MKVRIHFIGSPVSDDGEIPVDKEEEIPDFLENKEFFLLKRKLYPSVIAKSGISRIERAQ